MLQFDARAAKLLQAGDHLTWPETPGLRLEATASTRTWTYRYKSPVTGGMRQVKIGAWPAMPVGQALAEWERLRAERGAGHDVQHQRRQVRAAQRVMAAQPVALQVLPDRPTVGQLCAAYLDAVLVKRRKPKGLAEVRRLFDRHLGSLADVAAESVTRTQAFDLVHGMADTPVLASNLRSELGGVWDWALDSGRLPESAPNWWRLILRGKLASKGKIINGEHQGAPVKRVLTESEVGAVLVEMAFLTPLIRDLLTLYLWTGCRGAEICQIEGAEVTEEPDGWWWTIPRGKLKVSRHPLADDLRVPLVGRALEVVRRRIKQHGAGWLFPVRNPNATTPHVQQKVIDVAVWTRHADCTSRPDHERVRWSVARWAPHDLRRTVRTQLSRMGCSSEIGEAVLGHIKPGVEGVYDLHRYDAERREWLARLSDVWEAAAAAA